MARNGSGTYNLPSGNPVVTGTTIEATWANSTMSDIATALTQSLSKDGQTSMTGNLPMGTNKITGLGTPTNSTDAATKAYVDAMLAATQSWTGLNTFVRGTSASTDAVVSFRPSDYGSGKPGLWIYHNGAAGQMRFLMYDGTAATSQLIMGPGLQVGSPTGGDKGAQTLNVQGGIYQNNVAVLLASAIGSTVQAYSAELDTLAATGAANIPTLTGSNLLTNKTIKGAVLQSGGGTQLMDQNGSMTNISGIDLAVANVYKINGTTVVGARKTGWSQAGGTLTRTTFVTSTVTLEDLAERVAALIEDLYDHGLIGA